MSNIDDPTELLLDEYRFMQKAYELQFTHFMGVFYVWIPIITIPTGAGILSTLGSRPAPFGLLFCFIGCIGAFLSAKMFDIRRSQLRYLERTNLLRAALWTSYKLTEKTAIEPLGAGADLVKIGLTDFGRTMAITMSLVHGFLVGVGAHSFTRVYLSTCIAISGSAVLGSLFAAWNVWLFFKIVGTKPTVR